MLDKEEYLENAREYYEKEEYEQALKVYTKVINLDDKNKEAYRGIGDVYFQQKKIHRSN